MRAAWYERQEPARDVLVIGTVLVAALLDIAGIDPRARDLHAYLT